MSGDDEQEAEEAPPPSVPFFRLFAYADALDWTLMTLGSVAAAIHGAALPLYLYVLGRIINLFGSYQQDVISNPDLSLSSSLLQNLADQILKVNHFISILLTFILSGICSIAYQNSQRRKKGHRVFRHLFLTFDRI